MSLIIRTIQLFKHLPFPGKMIIYCIPSIQTSCSILQASSNVYQTPTVVSKYLLDSYCHLKLEWEHVLAFDSLCRARMGVAKHVLPFNSLCGAQTGVWECPQTFDSSCGAWMGVAKHLLAFDSLWTDLFIVVIICVGTGHVTLNFSFLLDKLLSTLCVVSNCAPPQSISLSYNWSIFRTIPLIVWTPPLSGKNR